MTTALCIFLLLSLISTAAIARIKPTFTVLAVQLQLLGVLGMCLYLARDSSTIESTQSIYVADRLGITVSLFVAGMGLVVATFANRSLVAHDRREFFFVYLLTVVCATISLSLSNVLWVMLVSWIVVSVATVLLIGFDGRMRSRLAARRAATLFTIGDVGLILAMSLAAIRSDGWSTSISEAIESLENEQSMLLGVFACGILLASFARSAQIPLHNWLPETVNAPTPVSALLHAGAVNGSAILFFRLYGLTESLPLFVVVGVGVGTVNVVMAIAVARTRPDIKSGLAWTTIAQMGFMTVQFSLGLVGPALVHMFMHGYFKSWLFLESSSALEGLGAHKHPTKRQLHPFEVASAVVIGALIVATAFAVVRPHFLDHEAVIVPVAFTWVTVSYVLAQWWSRVHKARAYEYVIPVLVSLIASTLAVAASALLEAWLGIKDTTAMPALISSLAIGFVAVVGIAWLIGIVIPRVNPELSERAWFFFATKATPRSFSTLHQSGAAHLQSRSGTHGELVVK